MHAMLRCQVTDVYPVPEMTIYRINEENNSPQVLNEVQQKIDRNPNGSFNVTISSEIKDYELLNTYGSQPNNYECLLIVFDGTKTNFMRKKRITYLTGLPSDPVPNNFDQDHKLDKIN